MFDYSMERSDDNDCPFFKIDKQPKTPLDIKFSKNFLEYLNPADFISAKLKKRRHIQDEEDEDEDDDT